MNTLSQLAFNSQRSVCLLASAAIVTVSLALGAFGVERMEHLGYSVTVTQLQ
jgi:hypothetical protein